MITAEKPVRCAIDGEAKSMRFEQYNIGKGRMLRFDTKQHDYRIIDLNENGRLDFSGTLDNTTHSRFSCYDQWFDLLEAQKLLAFYSTNDASVRLFDLAAKQTAVSVALPEHSERCTAHFVRYNPSTDSLYVLLFHSDDAAFLYLLNLEDRSFQGLWKGKLKNQAVLLDHSDGKLIFSSQADYHSQRAAFLVAGKKVVRLDCDRAEEAIPIRLLLIGNPSSSNAP